MKVKKIKKLRGPPNPIKIQPDPFQHQKSITLLINYRQRRVTSNPLHNECAKLYSKFKLQTKNLHPYT